MQKFATLSDAVALAEFAHRNQKDKAGMPYIDHPRRVLQKVQAQGAMPYIQMAAILHDVTEDTSFTPQMLLDLGFSEAVVELVKLLDRGISSHPTSPDYYYLQIRKNPGARMIKLADIEDNLSPWRLGYLSEDTQNRLAKKYLRAKLLIEEMMTPAAADQFMAGLYA